MYGREGSVHLEDNLWESTTSQRHQLKEVTAERHSTGVRFLTRPHIDEPQVPQSAAQYVWEPPRAGIYLSEPGREVAIRNIQHEAGSKSIRSSDMNISSSSKEPERLSNYAMSRWLSETPLESPWTAYHINDTSARTRNSKLLENLDEILTRFQSAAPDGHRLNRSFPYMSSSSVRRVSEDRGLPDVLHFNREHLILGSQNPEPSAAANTKDAATRASGNNRTTDRVTAVGRRGSSSLAQSQPSKLQLRSASTKTTALFSSKGGSTNNTAFTIVAPTLPAEKGHNAVPATCSNCGTDLFNIASPKASKAEAPVLSPLPQHQSLPPASPISNQLTTLSPSPTASEPLRTDNEDLKSHANAFISLLVAYGVCARGNTDHESGDSSNVSHEGANDSSRSSPFNQGYHTRRTRRSSDKRSDAGDDSDNESNPPQKRQKRRRPLDDIPGRRWACSFAKFDSITHSGCIKWKCVSIEAVKRHILEGKKHSVSPAVEWQIRALQPFKPPKGPGDRWKAFYCRLFSVPEEQIELVPSPYFDGPIRVTAGETATTLFKSPLPADPWTPQWDEAQNEQPINPHASAFANEATWLTERYEVQLNDLRLRVEQAQSQLRAIEAEQTQLEANLGRDLHRLLAGFRQNQAPELRRIEPVPLIPDSQPMIYNIPHVRPPFEAIIPGLLEGGGVQQRSHHDTLLPELRQASLSSDSGYGTLSDNTPCTCDEVWCFKCARFGKLYMPDGEVPSRDV